MARITRLGNTSMTTELTVERVADGATLAEGELRHVFVDPRELREARHARRGAQRARAASGGRRMIHLRIVAPQDVAQQALELLCAAPSVINVVHLHGAARSRRAT